MRYLLYCLYVSLLRFFTFCIVFPCFSTSFCRGFLRLFFCLFWFPLFVANPLHSTKYLKWYARHLNNNNHCTCWTFYATLALAHQQWTQHHQLVVVVVIEMIPLATQYQIERDNNHRTPVIVLLPNSGLVLFEFTQLSSSLQPPDCSVYLLDSNQSIQRPAPRLAFSE